MTKTVEIRRVILIETIWGFDKDPRKLYFFQRPPRPNNDQYHEKKGTTLRDSDGWAGVEDIRDATNLSDMESEKAMALFCRIKEALVLNSTVELVDLELTMVTKPVVFDPDALREHLREKALKKLTQDEIAALGITNLAIYDRVKNHNA